VYSAHRRDSFAVQVYEKSVDIAFQEQNIAELFKSIALVIGLYQELHLEGKVELYGYYLLLLMTHNISMAEWIQIYQKIPSRLTTKALQWYRSVRINDFLSISKLWKESDARERFILEPWLMEIRKTVSRTLVKAYRSLPRTVLKEWLAIEDDQDIGTILGAEIQANDSSVSFRKN
jgi:hypothetical protein